MLLWWAMGAVDPPPGSDEAVEALAALAVDFVRAGGSIDLRDWQGLDDLERSALALAGDRVWRERHEGPEESEQERIDRVLSESADRISRT